MKKEAKKSKLGDVILFFESEDDCIAARDALGQTRRRPVNLDRTHAGSYSKSTGHYGQVTRGDAVYKVPIKFKLIVDGDALDMLTWEQRNALRFIDGDSSSWIVK